MQIIMCFSLAQPNITLLNNDNDNNDNNNQINLMGLQIRPSELVTKVN